MITSDLTLYRKWYTNESTIGELVYKGQFFCFILEDPVRDVGEKIHGETAIPVGRYRMTKTWSPKYQRMMWLLLDVPNYAGVRCHSGNFPKDTEGCLLFGETKGINAVYNSRKTVKKFEELMDSEGITEIQIIDTQVI